MLQATPSQCKTIASLIHQGNRQPIHRSSVKKTDFKVALV